MNRIFVRRRQRTGTFMKKKPRYRIITPHSGRNSNFLQSFGRDSNRFLAMNRPNLFWIWSFEFSIPIGNEDRHWEAMLFETLRRFEAVSLLSHTLKGGNILCVQPKLAAKLLSCLRGAGCAAGSIGTASYFTLYFPITCRVSYVLE